MEILYNNIIIFFIYFIASRRKIKSYQNKELHSGQPTTRNARNGYMERIIIPCLECGLLWIRMVKLWSKEFYQK